MGDDRGAEPVDAGGAQLRGEIVARRPAVDQDRAARRRGCSRIASPWPTSSTSTRRPEVGGPRRRRRRRERRAAQRRQRRARRAHEGELRSGRAVRNRPTGPARRAASPSRRRQTAPTRKPKREHRRAPRATPRRSRPGRSAPSCTWTSAQLGPPAPGGDLGDVAEQQRVEAVRAASTGRPGIWRGGGARPSPATSPAPPPASPARWRAGSWSRAFRSGRRSAAPSPGSRRSSPRRPRRGRGASRVRRSAPRSPRAAARRAGRSRAPRRS